MIDLFTYFTLLIMSGDTDIEASFAHEATISLTGLGPMRTLQKLATLRRSVRDKWVRKIIKKCEKAIGNELEARAAEDFRLVQSAPSSCRPPTSSSPNNKAMPREKAVIINTKKRSEIPVDSALKALHASHQPDGNDQPNKGSGRKRKRVEDASPAAAAAIAEVLEDGSSKRVKVEKENTKMGRQRAEEKDAANARKVWSEMEVTELRLELQKAAAKLKAPNFRALAKKFKTNEAKLRSKISNMSRESSLAAGSAFSPSRSTLTRGAGEEDHRDERDRRAVERPLIQPWQQQQPHQTTTVSSWTPLRAQVR